MSTTEESIERWVRVALHDVEGEWPLSTSQSLAVALVLDRLDTQVIQLRIWTESEAIDRVGADWAAAIPLVAARLRVEGLIED